MKIFGLIVITLISLSAASEKWVTTGIVFKNTDSTKAQFLKELFIEELGYQYDIRLVSVTDSTVDVGDEHEQIVPFIQKYNASYGVSASIHHLGNYLYVNFRKYDSQGKLVFQERAKIIDDDDYENVIKRISKSLAREIPFAHTATSTTVTAYEAKRSKRKGNNLLLIGKAGFLYPMNESFQVVKKNYDYYSYDDSGSLSVESGSTISMEAGFAFDVDSWICEATAGFDGTRAMTFGVAANYLLSNSDFAPYVGLDMGATLVNKATEYEDYSDSLENGSDGISLGLRIGMYVFRNHNFKIFPEVRFFGVMNEDYDRGIKVMLGVMLN